MELQSFHTDLQHSHTDSQPKWLAFAITFLDSQPVSLSVSQSQLFGHRWESKLFHPFTN